jgi:hypothetical protein
VIIKLEELELTEEGLRLAVVVLSEAKAPKPTLRKAVRLVDTTGESVADVVPLRAVGGGR